jgi:single-strand DNA-binding protein
MLNQVTLIGRLGKDPEVKHFEGGNMVAQFSLATDSKYKNKAGEVKEETEWHNLVVWGKQAEIAEKYLKKGSQIHVTGKIKTRSWEADGVKKYITEIIVDRFLMLGTKGSGGSGTGAPTPEPGSNEDVKDWNPVAGSASEGPTDDLPF